MPDPLTLAALMSNGEDNTASPDLAALIALGGAIIAWADRHELTSTDTDNDY